ASASRGNSRTWWATSSATATSTAPPSALTARCGSRPADGFAMKASEIRKGSVVEHEGATWQVRGIERSAPQGRGGNVRFRLSMYSVPGGQRIEASFDADEELREVELSRRPASFSYRDGDAFVFMDDEDYTQYALDADVVGDAAGCSTDGLGGCHVQV